MNILEKIKSLLRRRGEMTKLVIKHNDGHMKGEVYVYDRNGVMWPDGTESKMNIDLDEVLKQAKQFQSEGNDVSITPHYRWK